MGKGWIWAAAVVAIVGIGAGTAGGAALRGGENALPEGLTVGGLSVGGLRADEAVARIRGRIAALEATRVAPDALRPATAAEQGEPRTAAWQPGEGAGTGGAAEAVTAGVGGAGVGAASVGGAGAEAASAAGQGEPRTAAWQPGEGAGAGGAAEAVTAGMGGAGAGAASAAGQGEPRTAAWQPGEGAGAGGAAEAVTAGVGGAGAGAASVGGAGAEAASAAGQGEPRTAAWQPGEGAGAGGAAEAVTAGMGGAGAEMASAAGAAITGGDALASGAAVAGGGAGASAEAAKAVTLAELGLAIEADDAIAALESFGEAKWWQRAAMKKTLQPSYGIAVSWDEDRLRAASDSAWADLASSPSSDASRTIDANDRIVYTAETLGTAVDMERLRSEVRGLAPTSLAARLDSAGDGGPIGGGSAGELAGVDPVDVASAGGGSGGVGRTVAVELPVRQVSPAVTVDSLKDEGLSRKIAEFATSFTTSGEGRSHNVTVTAEALDGTLLQPGEEFSYRDIVAKAEKLYGYQEAPVILNGKLTPGVGGGICQVSSTLYNAIIRVSGIDIVERRNHSLPVHYLPAGLDATFADGYIDFRFRNATGKQLLIKTVVKNKTLTVKLFGTMDESVSYEIETVQKKVIAPKTVFVADAKLKAGASSTVQRGEDGFVIESYRVKKVNGVFAERTKLATSTYKSQDAIVAVNASDPRLEAGGKSGGSGSGGSAGPAEPV